MVEDPDASLAEIASAVGLGATEGGPLFARHFKKLLGATPGGFRAALRGLTREARREFARGVIPPLSGAAR
jgi:AraC-like DNA-binding protein